MATDIEKPKENTDGTETTSALDRLSVQLRALPKNAVDGAKRLTQDVNTLLTKKKVEITQMTAETRLKLDGKYKEIYDSLAANHPEIAEDIPNSVEGYLDNAKSFGKALLSPFAAMGRGMGKMPKWFASITGIESFSDVPAFFGKLFHRTKNHFIIGMDKYLPAWMVSGLAQSVDLAKAEMVHMDAEDGLKAATRQLRKNYPGLRIEWDDNAWDGKWLPAFEAQSRMNARAFVMQNVKRGFGLLNDAQKAKVHSLADIPAPTITVVTPAVAPASTVAPAVAPTPTASPTRVPPLA